MKIRGITYAGHAAVFIKTDSFSIGLDPWIKGNPAIPETFNLPLDLSVIVLSHGHPDHAGDAPRLCREYDCKLAATYELAMIMGREGVPEKNLIPMNRGGTVDIKGIKVSLTTAFHSSSYETRNGPVYAGEACGIVISDGTTAIYHAGDTSAFTDMKLIGEQYRPAYALLPIGDHFTMGPDQAADAAKMVGCRAAIPIHYKTFEQLTGTLDEFRKACTKRSVDVIEIKPGESISV